MIRNLYFAGGSSSFARCFDSKFPRSRGPDGALVRGLPKAMVGLVATAVRAIYQLGHNANVKFQLYASINEWRKGVYQPTEFSADAYLDVYDGYIGTLNCIECERPSSFHMMMANLYDLARYVGHAIMITADPIVVAPISEAL